MNFRMSSAAPAALLATVLAASAATPPAAQAQEPDLSALHDALHLRPAQEASWRAYLAAVRPSPQVLQRRRSAAMMAATLPTPRRIDLLDAEMTEELKDVEREGEAVKTFYASLDPAQQKVFDDQTRPRPAAGPGDPSRPR